MDLLILAATRNHEADGSASYPVKVIIPYFGTVSITQFADPAHAHSEEARGQGGKDSTPKQVDLSWDQSSHDMHPASVNPFENRH
jgi:hypothetical protein